MLKESKAYSSFSVNNTQKAKDFYGNTLGLDISDVPEMEGLLLLKLSGGINILIYTKPDHEAATFTILNFPVENIEKTMDELITRGVKFEHFDEENMKTDDKRIAHNPGHKIAWFKDSAGNFLSVIEDENK